MAVPQYQKAVDKSRMTQALIWAKTIRDAERVYYLANGKYTRDLTDLDMEFSDCMKESATEESSTGVFLCEGKWRVTIGSWNNDTEWGVYVLLPQTYTPSDTSAGIQYYFHNDVRVCYATSDRFVQVCKNMGAQTDDNRGIHWYLP